MLTLNSIVVVLAAVSLAAGQLSLNSLSATCQAAITDVALSNTPCLAPGDLTTLALSPSNTSVIPLANKWLTDMCSSSPCTNSTINATVTSLVNGCSTDLASLGVDSLSPATAVAYSEQYYPVLREILCSQSNNNFCVTSTLTNLQTAIGQNLTIATVESPDFENSVMSISSAAVLCTDCTQTAYALIKQSTPELSGSSFENQLATVCGSNFVNAGEASDVSVPTATASASANSALVGVQPFQSFGAFGVLASAGMALVGSALALM